MTLTEATYFGREASEQYMSVSQLKRFIACEAAAIAELQGRIKLPETTAMLVGSYVDAHFTGERTAFLMDHPELKRKDGTLRADFVEADDIIKRLEQDALLRALLSGEHQKILTGDLEGVPFKCKMDSLLNEDQCSVITRCHPGMADTLLFADGAIVDLKVMRDFNAIYKPGLGRVSWVTAWNYDLQLSVYQRIEGRKLPCYIVAASKQDPPDVTLIHLPNYMLDAAYQAVRDSIPRYNHLKSHPGEAVPCGRCEWCRSSKIITRPVGLDELEAEES
jgi:hypothetical protein